MARAIRTAGLALIVAVAGTAAVAVGETLDPGGDQAAKPPSSKPPSTSVAVRATPEQPTGPAASPSTRARVPRLVSSAVPWVVGDVAAAESEVTPAQVAAVEADEAPGWQERLGAAALQRLDYSLEDIDYRVDFLPGRDGYLGMTFPERRVIEIYVRDGLTVEDVARNTAHELGHAFDFTHNTTASRQLYKQLRGIDNGGWLACRGCTDLSTPAGDFAETFAYWLMDGEFPSRSKLGNGAPDIEQLLLLAPLFTATPPAS